MSRAAAALLLLVGLAAPRASAAPAGEGILLLAHGGDPAWNAEVEKLRAAVSSAVPTALALGMSDPETIQAGVDELEAQHVSLIVAVPLFVNSDSEVMTQTRYTLGLSDKPSEILRAAEKLMRSMPMPPGMAHHHMHMFSLKRVTHKADIVLAPALDADPFVSGVLLERAKALSQEPAKETVVLVAHGPVDAAAVPDWEKALAVHAASLAKAGGFRGVETALLRDDAAPEVRAKAVAAMRVKVEAAAKAGKAIVVPVLIARGGIEDKIPRDLAGLTFAWSGDALLPHAGFDKWVLKRADEAIGHQ